MIVNKEPAIINKKETSTASYCVCRNSCDRYHTASVALEYQAIKIPIILNIEVFASNLRKVRWSNMGASQLSIHTISRTYLQM